LFWDIGGAGAKADACAIWVVQWPGQEIRVLDYTEGQGQVLGYYEVIPNQGAGAVAMRIEAVRRLFPRCWFNEKTTEQESKRSASITRKRMNNGPSELDLNTIGQAMRLMRSG